MMEPHHFPMINIYMKHPGNNIPSQFLSNLISLSCEVQLSKKQKPSCLLLSTWGKLFPK